MVKLKNKKVTWITLFDSVMAMDMMEFLLKLIFKLRIFIAKLSVRFYKGFFRECPDPRILTENDT